MDKSGKTTSYNHIPRVTVEPSAGLKRHAIPRWTPQREASTSGAVPQGQGPLPDAPATVNVRGESTAAASSGELAANRATENAAPTQIKFPLCDAALQKIDGGNWDLADAILAECCEPGEDGVRNESYSKLKAMRQEIVANHGVQLSFERIRKLRKVASAFPAGRRRPGVSLECHLEAGSPDELDELIKGMPNGTTLTRNYIRGRKHPTEKVEEDQQKAERRHQKEDQRTAFLDLCREQEWQTEKLMREKEEREQRYIGPLSRRGKEPEPFSPPLSPEDEPSLTDAEDLERAIRVLLTVRGFDPKADYIKRAIEEFVRAVLALQH